jgi:hypothetical protein
MNVVLAGGALAQRQVTMQTPLRGVSDSFFERIGFSANFRGPGFTANLGGFPLAVPQFGGFQPGAGLVGGFSVNGRRFSADFGFEFSQGSRRTAVSQTPSVTMMDGTTAIFADVTQSPFVISTPFDVSSTPVVPLRAGAPWKQHTQHGGVPLRSVAEDFDAPAAAKPAARRDVGQADDLGNAVAQQVAAQGNRPLRSVAEIRRQREAEEEGNNEEALRQMQQGEQAERDGKPGVAKIFYQMALRHATGDLKRQLQERVANLTR